MSVVIRLGTTAAGIATEFDGLYVVAYDPTVRLPDGSYDGGLLEVTSDPQKALRFANIAEAIAKYRQRYGWREDGGWNRPLTAWSIELEEVKETA